MTTSPIQQPVPQPQAQPQAKPAPQSVPTQPVQQPSIAQPTEDISQVQAPTNVTISIQEIMYMLTCYCYIHASKIGYQALKDLNTSFVVINTLANPDIANVTDEVESADSEIGAMVNPPPVDTLSEPQVPGVTSDNTDNH